MKSFTIIETFLAIGIIAVIVVLAIPFYQKFQVKMQLDTTVDEIVQNLRKAQAQSMASKGDKVYGVRLESKRYILFGGTYVENDPHNEIYNLAPTLEIYNLNLNPNPGITKEITFSRVLGTTSNYGFFSIKNINNETRTIFINRIGLITTD